MQEHQERDERVAELAQQKLRRDESLAQELRVQLQQNEAKQARESKIMEEQQCLAESRLAQEQHDRDERVAEVAHQKLLRDESLAQAVAAEGREATEREESGSALERAAHQRTDEVQLRVAQIVQTKLAAERTATMEAETINSDTEEEVEAKRPKLYTEANSTGDRLKALIAAREVDEMLNTVLTPEEEAKEEELRKFVATSQGVSR